MELVRKPSLSALFWLLVSLCAPPAGALTAEPVQPPLAPAEAEPAPADVAAVAPSGELDEPADDSDDAWLFEEEYEDPAGRDPLEPSNRAVFGLNEFLFRWVLDPVTDGYQWAVPRPVRRSLMRFFDNLGEPAVLVNELLQLNPRRAGITSARFVVNTTVGLVGLFDPATGFGLGGNETDFGETLGVYGLGAGWYLVVPVIGPTTARDLVGSVVNSLLHPQVYLLGTGSVMLLAGGGGLSEYDVRQAQLESMRASSVDFYAAMRSAYLMNRAAGVRDARGASLAWGGDDEAQEPSSEVPASASAILLFTAASSASKPSFFSTLEYSERRSASSETVPLR